MSAHVEVEQAARLRRAEDRWRDQCADRLRRARRASAEPAEPTTPTRESETLR